LQFVLLQTLGGFEGQPRVGALACKHVQRMESPGKEVVAAERLDIGG
jgi:hypothetical protein